MTKSLLIALNSRNTKLGNVVATYRPVGSTCPQDCELLNKGCYAQRGMSAYQANNSNWRNDNLDKIKDGKCVVIRHNVSGDCFKNDKLDLVYVNKLIKFHRDNPEYIGWLYTHRIQDWISAGFRGHSMPNNLSVIASCDTDTDIAVARRYGFKYARVTESVIGGVKLNKHEVLCPIDSQKVDGKRWNEIKSNCEKCRLCFDAKYVNLNIVFSKHNGHESKQKSCD